MSATKTIIIAAPKFIAADSAFEVALSPGNTLLNTNIRKNNQMRKASFQCVSTMEKITCASMSVVSMDAPSAHSKKRRLDHLSLDEKIQRKKLKNRIAAQSSRDRKKAKMDDLESEVRELKEEKESLAVRCLRLEEESQRLAEENRQLREQLSQTRRVGCEPTAVTGPAESWASDPPQQGRGSQPARGLTLLTLLLMAVSHHYPTSWMSSTAMTSSLSSKSWQAASLKKLLQTGLQMKEKRIILEAVARETEMLKWWGPHQKTWNPVEIQ